MAGTSCRVAGRKVLSGREARVSKNAMPRLSKASAAFVNKVSDSIAFATADAANSSIVCLGVVPHRAAAPSGAKADKYPSVATRMMK